MFILCSVAIVDDPASSHFPDTIQEQWDLVALNWEFLKSIQFSAWK